jgi:hypothetical protein
MKTDDGFTLERTGNVFSFASTEYRVTYPDGHVGTLWSPPWHEDDDDVEDAKALEAAREMFRQGIHNKPDAKVRVK